MKICRPLWAEGTFLSSQQFQQQARWEAFSNDCIAQLCIRHPWGIANVLFDRDALTPGKLKTQAVRLRFADGTLIDSDVSDVLPLACDLRALKNDSAIVLLALPLAHGNGGNLGQGEQTERPLRYRQEWQKVQDIYGSDSEDTRRRLKQVQWMTFPVACWDSSGWVFPAARTISPRRYPVFWPCSA